jgi:tRNA-splicing ligase RtcB
MDTNELLRHHGYQNRTDLDFGEVARFAASLEGDEHEIYRAVEEKFGPPPERMTMKETSHLRYIGEPGIHFDKKTIAQMRTALEIPVALEGVLMPDAHLGYALPIGGVVALENAVSPSFVGYDIACRMTLTILDEDPEDIYKNREKLLDVMEGASSFGLNSGFDGPYTRDHPIMYDPMWNQLRLLTDLKEKAQRQLGSSGGGNHFFDLVHGSVLTDRPWLPVEEGGTFSAIMTHSGSRGTGHNLATFYQKLAKSYIDNVAVNIPSGYEWLSLDTDAGLEYWRVMQLMGRYAQANHHLIHTTFIADSGISPLARFENHHNFAWVAGDEDNTSDPRGKTILHRKGATPARKGQVGIIPGTSGTKSYLVEGLGNEEALVSSSHGAGRRMSRTEAKKTFSFREFEEYMEEKDILFRGIGLDEVPGAYKDIEEVIKLQDGLLVRPVAVMFPMAVIMGGKSDDGD